MRAYTLLIWTGPEGQRRNCFDYWPPGLCTHGKLRCICANHCLNCWVQPNEGTLKGVSELLLHSKDELNEVDEADETGEMVESDRWTV